MKKIILFLITLIMAIGCACATDKASDPVKEYLNKYKNGHETIIAQLDDLVKEENLTETQGEKYKEIMTKQYKDLTYKITNETYNGDEATVTTKITVYDLYSIQREAEEYQNNNKKEFIDEDGNYDKDKFLDYKLEEMKKNTKTIEYTIDFKVIKKDGIWTLENVSTEDLEKIHGIYNYTND